MKPNRFNFRAWNGSNMVSDISFAVKGGSVINIADEVMPWLLMQSTGLVDRNGQEIFEDDIVKCTFDWRDDWHEIAKIEFDSNQGYYPAVIGFTFDWTFTGHEVEVIGNIWENKELLEKK